MAGVLETVQCTGCGRSYGFQEKHRGKVLKCRACGGKVVIPEKAAELDVLEVVPQLEALPDSCRSVCRGRARGGSRGGGCGGIRIVGGGGGRGAEAGGGLCGETCGSQGEAQRGDAGTGGGYQCGAAGAQEVLCGLVGCVGFYAKRRAATYSRETLPRIASCAVPRRTRFASFHGGAGGDGRRWTGGRLG